MQPGEPASPISDDCVGDWERLEQIKLADDFARLLAAVHIKLAINALRLRFYCVDGNDQFPRYFRIRATSGEQAQHAPFLRAQWLERHHGDRRYRSRV